MANNERKVGEINAGDLRLLQRVQQLVQQALTAQALIQAHFTGEYQLNPTRSIRADGGIWESLSAEAVSPPPQ